MDVYVWSLSSTLCSANFSVSMRVLSLWQFECKHLGFVIRLSDFSSAGRLGLRLGGGFLLEWVHEGLALEFGRDS
jgi:hypothetical protein